jgi:hypothetical protein
MRVAAETTHARAARDVSGSGVMGEHESPRRHRCTRCRANIASEPIVAHADVPRAGEPAEILGDNGHRRGVSVYP